MDGDSKTMLVIHSYGLRAFTTFGGAHNVPPFGLLSCRIALKQQTSKLSIKRLSGSWMLCF